MWSLTSPRTNRISGPRNFRSLVKKDFFNTIGQKQTLTLRSDDARFTSKADIVATQTDVCFVPIADIDDLAPGRR